MAQDAGVVDHHVQPPVGADDVRHHRVPLLLGGDVKVRIAGSELRRGLTAIGIEHVRQDARWPRRRGTVDPPQPPAPGLHHSSRPPCLPTRRCYSWVGSFRRPSHLGRQASRPYPGPTPARSIRSITGGLAGLRLPRSAAGHLDRPDRDRLASRPLRHRGPFFGAARRSRSCHAVSAPVPGHRLAAAAR